MKISVLLSYLSFQGRYILSEGEASVYMHVVSWLQSAFLVEDNYILSSKPDHVTPLG